MDENLELVRRIRNGDEEAFEMLLENHKKMIYKLIYNSTLEAGDYAIDVDEVFQEASLILYRAVFTFEEDKKVKFSSYAYLVLKSRIRNVFRSYYNIYKEESYSIDSHEHQDYLLSLAIKEDPIRYHKEQEFRKRLDRFIEDLSAQDRQILELRGDQLSYKEISNLLHISTKKIDNRLRILRKRMGQYFNDEK